MELHRSIHSAYKTSNPFTTFQPQLHPTQSSHTSYCLYTLHSKDQLIPYGLVSPDILRLLLQLLLKTPKTSVARTKIQNLPQVGNL
jgi:hypothetical protein